MTVLRDFRRDWGGWSFGERFGAVLIALLAFGAPIATFFTTQLL